LTALFLSFYFVPAAIVLIALWAVWRLVRLVDLSVGTRRVLFVALGTIGLAPMLVPAGTIMAAWVPHGLLLLMPDLSYYFRFLRVVVTSFAVTAVVLGLAAWWLVRRDVRPVKASWTTLVVPFLVIGGVALLYRHSFPNRDIPAHVTTQAIESAYGKELDAVAALSGLEDPEQRRSAVAKLRREFESDPAVLRVSYPGSTGVVRGDIFHYRRGESPPSISCSGVPPAEQRGLIRCTWSYGRFERADVLKYSRSARREGSADVVIEFDYDEALVAFTR
jgi:hypothetical protein